MATLDGLTLRVLVNELNGLLTGGRIDKITEPDRDEINIVIRSAGQNHKLLICARPDSCRIHITNEKRQSPTDAPMFCMLLRKHLTGGKIVSVTQPNTDRIVRIETDSTDELYNINKYFIICELMGRHSNIILTNAEGIIIDSIKRVGISVSQARSIVPNVKYELPPTEKKHDPLKAEEQDILSALQKSGRADKILSDAFYGVAPVVAMHILETAGVTEHSMTEDDKVHLSRVMHRIVTEAARAENSKVYLARRGDKTVFLPFKPALCDYDEYESPSAMLDEYYAEREHREYMKRCAYSLTHAVEAKLKRAQKRLACFDEAIANEGDCDKLRIYGELVCANAYKISPGQSSVTVENYYAEPSEQIEIPLDESLSAMKNSQRYFKLYKKARGARDTALKMREEVLSETEYLQCVADSIARAENTEDLEEIRAELEDGGYIRTKQQKRRKKPKKQPPHKFISSDGYTVYVGRNNLQNDELTLKTASGNDMWLHVKNRPGSHTVIINPSKGEIPQTTLQEAAELAARYSSAGESGAKVEVDYTLCRFVKKPSGALPGKVIYTNQRTLTVTP